MPTKKQKAPDPEHDGYLYNGESAEQPAAEPRKPRAAVSVMEKAKAAAAAVEEPAPAKKPAKKKSALKVGFRKQDLPEQYANDKKINERQREFEKKGPRLEVVQDAWEGMLERRMDDSENPPDPFTEAVDQIREPGKAYRMLSPHVMKRRGKRNWELVHDKDGKQIEVAGQLLASMPIDKAVKRNKKYQQVSIDAVNESREQFQDAAERVAYESRGAVEVLKPGDIVRDRRTRHGEGKNAAVIGVESFRG